MINLTGNWVGETQGRKTKRHCWLITQDENHLHFETWWEGESNRVSLEGVSVGTWFTIPTDITTFLAAIHDNDTFTIYHWVTDEQRRPAYDVVFRRVHTLE